MQFDKLIVLCASHIQSKQRLYYLNDMLNSWSNQSRPSILYISISYSNELKDDVYELLAKWHNINIFPSEELEIYIIQYRKRQSQFSHYTYLLQEYKEELKDKWIMFTDDDDLWNSNRILEYYQIAYGKEKNNKNNKKRQCFGIHKLIEYHDDYTNLIDKNNIDMDLAIQQTRLEYVDYCAKYEIIMQCITEAKKLERLSSDRFVIHFAAQLRLYMSTVNPDSEIYSTSEQNCAQKSQTGYKNWLYLHRQYDKIAFF